MRFENDTVLITGAATGIGEETAKRCASEGAHVVVTDVDETGGEETVEAIESRDGPGSATFEHLDVTDAERFDELAVDVAEEHGLDVLVNNAGVMLLEAVADADTDNWRRMVEVNLLAVMNATHAALPIMREQGYGHVVNVSSVAGRQASASASGYNATKFGVNGFTEAFRQEVAEDGIRTTLIEPGIVDTELQEHIPDEEIKRETEAWVDSLDPLTGEDIAETIRFAVTRPRHVSVNELLVRPTQQEM